MADFDLSGSQNP